MSTDWMVEALAELVGVESPSSDIEATTTCAQATAHLIRNRLNAVAEVVEAGGRRHLRYTWGKPRVLILGHLDTVWPIGTLKRWPFSVTGDVATGPGVFDMKGGIIQSIHALGTLSSLEGIRLLLTTDEEIGSPTSSQLILDSVRGCAAALVCEPSAAGALKIARKGIGRYRLDFAGRAAHAGLEPEQGANAAVAAARTVVSALSLDDADLGTTVTATTLTAGIATNTVPPEATICFDVRSALPAELARVDRELRRLATSSCGTVSGTSVAITGGINRPPLDPQSSAAVFRCATKLANELGLAPVEGVAVGGASDGNITAGAGVPTLDGLGAVGAGAHAEGEHLLLPHMEPRARLLAALIEELR